MSKPKVYSYIRFSTPDQGNRKTKSGKENRYRNSEDRQDGLAAKWCERTGHRLEKTTYRDLGISAFGGDNATVGKLGQFIEAVDKGDIPAGSILLVESLDRLSRQQVHHALELFLGILRRGIIIQTLEPEERFELATLQETQLIVAIIFMSRAFNESSTKSSRVKAAWDKKREKIKERPLTKQGPSWLKLVNGKWVEVPEKVALVRDIFKKSTEGTGVISMVRHLNQNNILSLKGNSWHGSSVLKVLHSRSVFGEFTPRHGRGGTTASKRPVAGEIVEDYYPAILTKDEFDAAQLGLKKRRTQAGRKGKNVTNLFPGLLYWDGTDHSMIITNKGEGPSVVNSAAARGLEGNYIAFRYEVWEKAFLAFASGITASEIFPVKKSTEKQKELAESNTKLAAVISRIDDLSLQVEQDPDYAVLLPTIKKLRQGQRALEERTETLRAELTTEDANTLAESVSLIHQLSKAKGEDLIDLRTRLRAKITDMVERVDMSIVQDDTLRRTLTATIRFVGGKTRQVYCRKIVTYGGGGNTNPKPSTAYIATSDKGGHLFVSDVTVLVR